MAGPLPSSVATSRASTTATRLTEHAASTAAFGIRAARVVHLQRKPVPDHFSIEGLFANLRNSMRGSGFDIEQAVAPNHSKGFWPRVMNIIWAAQQQGDVNHITGDDHYLALLLPRDRTVLTIHDCYALERLRGLKRWLMRIFWFDLPVRRATVVTVISDETKRQLMRHVRVAADKIVVVPDAVAPVFCPCPKTFNSVCPRILHLGTKANKNLPRLIEALSGFHCTLHIVGQLSESLRQQLDRSGVTYDAESALSEAEMYRAYCEADIVSFVSTYEGFGLPIIEAQSVERPVVTSNCSSMPEVAGDGACLVDPLNVDSIRHGLQRVIHDAAYREQLVELGRKNRKRFSLAEVAKQYVSIYDRLLATRSSCNHSD